jgi:hypothetical protein
MEKMRSNDKNSNTPHIWEIEIERNKKPFQEFQMQTSSKKLKLEKNKKPRI